MQTLNRITAKTSLPHGLELLGLDGIAQHQVTAASHKKDGKQPHRSSVQGKDVSDQHHKLEGLSILILEDELIIGLDLTMSIEDLGGIVIGPIPTVEDGICALSDDDVRSQIDVAILDINLHGEEVFPVAAMLNELGVPFVFHTAHGVPTDLGKDWPGVPVCNKPMSPEHLLGTVERLVTG